ncbi:MAG: choline dehydrogenase [Chromatiales bacterium]|jgi:choline dehydrogenase|nr:choline dehydrogenase [Chromatiales bacterium]
MQQQVFDYVIVGAGSAGCVLANRLTEAGDQTALLLEAGPPDSNPWIHIPIGYGKTMFHPELNWGFRTEPQSNLDDRSDYWPRGRTLGGSSAINGMIQIRGQAEDFDGWAALGADGWSAAETLPYFIKSEANSRGANPYHGDSGPLKVSDIRDRHPLVDAFIAGAGELGVPATDDFNGTEQEGAGYLQLTIDNGKRCSAATAYLRPARRRDGLTVTTDAMVTRIEFEGTRATGVRYVHNGGEHVAQARLSVIVCAGALQTPQLLQVSGVGPSQLLRAHDIPVVADREQVGENLQDHLLIRLIYKCKQPITTNDDLRSPLAKLKTGLKWLLFRRGPMAVGVMMGGVITKVMPDAKTPDVQYFISTVSAEERGKEPHSFSGFTVSLYPMRPGSRGHVRIKSPDPAIAPAIQPNYLSSNYDRSMLIAGAKMARALAKTTAMSQYIEDEYKPGSAVQSDEDVLDFVKRSASTAFHPVGTCRMGNDPDAVVDSRLRVNGVTNLRVVDASVMPTLVSGNTNAATIMIAEKASDMIREDFV